MNPNHHGSDEQMFGTKQQLLHGEGRLRRRFANERRVNLGVSGGVLLLLPLKTSRLRTRTARPPAAFVWCLRLKRPSRRTRSAGPPRKRQSAAWAYKTDMGPITKLYWRRLNTQFTTGASRRTDEPP